MFRGTVFSFYLIKSVKYDWFHHKGALLDFSDLPSCLQSIPLRQKKNSVLHTFFYFLHLFVLKYLLRVFPNAILSKCYRLLKISKRWTEKRRNLSILSNSILLAWRSILENNSMQMILASNFQNVTSSLKLCR